MRKLLLIFIVMFASTGLYACGIHSNESNADQTMQVYYLNKEETKIETQDYTKIETDTKAQVGELLTALETQPGNLELKAPIAGFKILNYSIEEKQVVLNVDDSYKKMETSTEILSRAAIVRTLTQIEGVEYVTMNVANNPLKDKTGDLIGTMTADTFVDIDGTDVNSFERTKIKLYFANKSGDGLIGVTRDIVYNSNISTEKLVVEQMIQGPASNETYPTINPDTKVLGVTVKDGVCYVNLDETFLTQPYQVSSDVTLYSLINSLVELSNVNKVQISINGDSDIKYKEKIDLSNVLERNLELVQ